jgi:hypothetical protein
MVDTKRLDDNHVSVECIDCKKTFTLPLTVEQERAWRAGGLIQRIAPELADDAEILISGECSACFDALFSGLDEEVEQE